MKKILTFLTLLSITTWALPGHAANPATPTCKQQSIKLRNTIKDYCLPEQSELSVTEWFSAYWPYMVLVGVAVATAPGWAGSSSAAAGGGGG